jgi:hypothetical protein
MGLRIGLAFAFALSLLAPPAGAFDATGTWEGSWTCTGFNGAKTKTDDKDSTLEINGLQATLDGLATFTVLPIDDTADPTAKGEMALFRCATDNQPVANGAAEMLRLKVKVNAAKGTGTISGTSILEDGTGGVASCKYKFKRTSTTGPEISVCFFNGPA